MKGVNLLTGVCCWIFIGIELVSVFLKTDVLQLCFILCNFSGVIEIPLLELQLFLFEHTRCYFNIEYTSVK